MSNEEKKERPRSAFYIRSPGPGAYKLPPLLGRPSHAVTHSIRPEYSLAKRLDIKNNVPGPGVGKYGVTWGLTYNGQHQAPAFSMIPRNDSMLKFKSPGPAANSLPELSVYRPSSPAFTIRQRPPFLRQTKIPAPNAYFLPPVIGPKTLPKHAQPDVAIKGKKLGIEIQLGPVTPGPANYSPVSPDMLKPRAPVFSMAKGYKPKPLWVTKCGPASYTVDKTIFPLQPAYSFGVRFNDFTANMITECDKPRQLFSGSR